MSIIGAGTLGVLVGSAEAAIPADQVVRYHLRETPTDPKSEIVFTVLLDLVAADRDGDFIGWDIVSVSFEELTGGGAPPLVWVEYTPTIDTPDGLWWIEHTDPMVPETAEFTLPPLLHGAASASNRVDPRLNYSFEGVVYTPPPAGAPYEITAAVDCLAVEEGETEPVADGDDEPVEMPRGVDDPT